MAIDCQVTDALSKVGLANVLVIEGDDNDTLKLFGWTNDGPVGAYDIYSLGSVQIAVEGHNGVNGIDVTT